MIPSIVATIVGLLVAVGVVAATAAVNHAPHPPPESIVAAIRKGDSKAMRQAGTRRLPRAPQISLILFA